jgi:hypothetical protein
MRLDPAVGALLTLALAALFASAAAHKLRHPGRFRATLSVYRLLPRPLELPVAAGLVALETLLAPALLWPQSRVPAACSGAALLVLYALAIAVNLRRGRRHIDCGCGGAAERRPIHSGLIWRNAALAALLLASTIPWSPRPWAVTDAITILLGTAAAILLYRSIDSLFAATARRPAPSDAIS